MQLLEKAKGEKHQEDEEGENGSVPFDDQKLLMDKNHLLRFKRRKDQLLAEIKKAFDEDVEDDSDSDSDEKEQAENNDDDDFSVRRKGNDPKMKKIKKKLLLVVVDQIYLIQIKINKDF